MDAGGCQLLRLRSSMRWLPLRLTVLRLEMHASSSRVDVVTPLLCGRSPVSCIARASARIRGSRIDCCYAGDGAALVQFLMSREHSGP